MLPNSMTIASPKLARLILATAAGVLVMGLGTATLAGWILGIPLLVQFRPQYQPMFYTTSLLFALSGATLLLLIGGSRLLALLLAAIVAVIAAPALVLQPPGIPAALHIWLSEHLFLLRPNPPGRLAPLSAICFLAFTAGVAVLTLRSPQVRWRAGVVRLLGAGISSFGAIGAIGYLLGLGIASRQTPVTFMSALATPALVLMGIGLFAVTGRDVRSRVGGPQWLPAIVGVVSLIAALGLWQAVRNDQRLQRALEESQAASNIDGQLAAQYSIDHRQLTYIAEQLAVAPDSWASASRPYLVGQPSHRVVLWIDQTFIVRRVAGADNPPLDNLNLGAKAPWAARLRDAAATHAQVSLRADDLQSGRLSLLIAEPVIVNEEFIGFVAGIIDIEAMLRLTLRNDEALGFGFTAHDGTRVVYQSAEEEDAEAARYNRTLSLGPLSLRLYVWPTRMRLTREADQLPTLVLAFGLAVTLLLTVTIAAAQTARRRWTALDRVNHRLAGEIARRQRAQRELQQMAAELKRSNRELEDFAAIASHDLRAPLQKVKSFADVLDEEYQPCLDPEGRDVLQRLRRSIQRMQRLVDDLLQLARVRASGLPFTRVDLAQVAREVVSDLEPILKTIGGRVEIGELPVIDADPTQMQQLLQNLVGNGLKFQRKGEVPVIRIEADVFEDTLPGNRRGEPLCQLRVCDNGIGFENKYAQRIFRAFERLHGQQEYEGSGIGLAVCAKIVERHGGSITANSAPGEGATFLVTLPVRHSPTAAGQHLVESAEIVTGSRAW